MGSSWALPGTGMAAGSLFPGECAAALVPDGHQHGQHHAIGPHLHHRHRHRVRQLLQHAATEGKEIEIEIDRREKERKREMGDEHGGRCDSSRHSSERARVGRAKSAAQYHSPPPPPTTTNISPPPLPPPPHTHTTENPTVDRNCAATHYRRLPPWLALCRKWCWRRM